MAAVPEVERIAALSRFGVSEPLVNLAKGICVHATFRDCCLGPPYYAYHGAAPPAGPHFVPLWDHGDTVVGVRQLPDGLEFFEYCIEADDPNEYEQLARTEQGFWATRFDLLYECESPLEELEEAAAAVGFRFLGRYLESVETAGSRLATSDGHVSWLRELVATIDREVGSADAT